MGNKVMIPSNHLAFTDTLTTNLKPLLPTFLQTSVFGYRCFDRSGKSFGWSDNKQWNHFFINHLSEIMLGRYETEVTNTYHLGKYHIVRMGLPAVKDELSRHLYQLGIWNTICCYIKCNDFIEGFYFSNAEGGADWVNYYLNQSYLLEQYYTDFKEKLLSIAKRSEFLQFSQSTVNPNIFSAKNQPEEPIKKIKTPETLLTTRERECLDFISAGYTSKEIARCINRSPRTIEWYIENIKRKLGVDKKTDLLKSASQARLVFTPTCRLEAATPNNPNMQPKIK